jgi:hypothetical protein
MNAPQFQQRREFTRTISPQSGQGVSFGVDWFMKPEILKWQSIRKRTREGNLDHRTLPAWLASDRWIPVEDRVGKRGTLPEC